VNPVIWVEFPKRLRTALNALSALAGAKQAMLSHEIADEIGVTRAETAKVLQLLVWGGFVTSRRGSKGGFHLANGADRITTGSVIRFFLARHRVDEDGGSKVMRVLRQTGAPCQEAFARLTIADIAASDHPRPRRSKAVSAAHRRH
jgi:Rrf2 family protein